jgi:phage terminase large subunit-like protein
MAQAASWATALPDWQTRIRTRQSLLPPCPWHRDQADKALRIFGGLQLPDVPGTPFLRDASGPWLPDLITGIFGSYDPAAHVRHLREFGVMVPKKNAKTTGGAGTMLTAMLMSPRPRAEFLIVAPTQEISDVSFAQCVGMVELNPYLQRRCQVQMGHKKITDRRTGSFVKVKSFSPDVLTGSKPAGTLLDEIHVIADKPNADRVIGQLRGGMISQPEAFLLQITTQSERPPSGVFLAELRKWRAVRDGTLQAPILPLLYELPPGLDWRDPATWPMVNPNDGFSLDVARLGEDYAQADAASPEELRRWASQHLNVEIGVALLGDAWPGADFWESAATKLPLPLETILELCDLVEIGIDGGGLKDMLGLAVLGRDKETGDWLLWTHAWLHPIALERQQAQAARFRDFAAEGDLTIVDEIGQDVAQVAAICAQVERSGKLDKIGVDPVGIASVLDALGDVGLDETRVVGVPQGWKLSGAIKTCERRLAEGALFHGGSRLMNWCAGNAKVEPRGNAVTVTKQLAGYCKIDPLCALFNAAALLSMNPQPRLDVADWIA